MIYAENVKRYKRFLDAEISRKYFLIYDKIRKNYFQLIFKEETAYKKTNKYKELRSKEYWNRPKEEIDTEQLDEILSKLDYWVPTKSPGDTHITYANKAMRDSTNSDFNWDIPIGFVPSITIEDYFHQETNKLKQITDSKLVQMVLDLISTCSNSWTASKLFDSFCNTEFSRKGFNAKEQLLSLKNLSVYLEIEKDEELNTLPDEFQYCFTTHTINVVVNKSKVIAENLETHKETAFFIDILKNENQEIFLGRCLGEEVYLIETKSTYKIKKILV